MVLIINLSNYISRGFTNSEGEIIRGVLEKHLRSGEIISVSFNGIDSVSTSFVNSAFVDLLNEFTFDYIKKHLSFSNTTRSINDVIRRRFIFEVNERKNLIEV